MDMWSTGEEEPQDGGYTYRDSIRDLRATVAAHNIELENKDELIRNILDDIKDTNPDIFLKYLDKVKGK